MLKHISLAAVLALAAVPVAAENAPASADGKLDPNRKICQKEELIGSRVKTRKVCMTAEQWQAKSREHRKELDGAEKKSESPKSL